MDWTQWIADLLAAGIGGLIGGTLGAYFKSYWTEKGKNLATYEDIKTLLAEERGKAYEQEKGKRLATHEDIQNVLAEVRSVTRETESIKAQIGSDLWTRQRVWEQKREIYSNLLKSSDLVLNSILEFIKQITLKEALAGGVKNVTGYEAKDLAARGFGFSINSGLLGEKRTDVSNAMRHFMGLFNEAYIFINPKACECLYQFVTIYSAHVQNLNDGNDCGKALVILGKTITTLTEAAKEDLGVPVYVQ
jgi:hypothetical protein